MSTAKTVVGCLAEDYTSELAEICRQWIAEVKYAYGSMGTPPSDEDQRLLNVAESFVQSAY